MRGLASHGVDGRILAPDTWLMKPPRILAPHPGRIPSKKLALRGSRVATRAALVTHFKSRRMALVLAVAMAAASQAEAQTTGPVPSRPEATAPAETAPRPKPPATSAPRSTPCSRPCGSRPTRQPRKRWANGWSRSSARPRARPANSCSPAPMLLRKPSSMISPSPCSTRWWRSSPTRSPASAAGPRSIIFRTIMRMRCSTSARCWPASRATTPCCSASR